MTNEELDRARVDEAMRLWDGSKGSLAVIAARLAREGWTPPVAVDPDMVEAKYMAQTARAERLTHTGGYYDLDKLAFIAIKAGRALAAEAKPGLVWVKHDGSEESPVDESKWVICIYKDESAFVGFPPDDDRWGIITHYAIITQPAEDVA